jgi:lipoprotein
MTKDASKVSSLFTVTFMSMVTFSSSAACPGGVIRAMAATKARTASAASVVRMLLMARAQFMVTP